MCSQDRQHDTAQRRMTPPNRGIFEIRNRGFDAAPVAHRETRITPIVPRIGKIGYEADRFVEIPKSTVDVDHIVATTPRVSWDSAQPGLRRIASAQSVSAALNSPLPERCSR
jgi:hypothetical protein